MSYIEDVVQFISASARILVDEPDAVSVRASEAEGRLGLYLTVAINDGGKVIGKQGRIVRSLRGILLAASNSSGIKTTLQIEGAELHPDHGLGAASSGPATALE